MKMTLHHLNLTTTNVPKMNDFYRNVMGLAAEPTLNSARITNQGYSGETAFATDGHVQVHMSERDLALGFRQKQFVNPLERGHIAFRTDDIAAFKKRLDEKGVPYSDYGTWAMNGWHQIFFHDPDGNVVEVHQGNEGARLRLITRVLQCGSATSASARWVNRWRASCSTPDTNSLSTI